MTTDSPQLEAEMAAVTSCPFCHSTYRASDRQLACRNCGSPLVLADDLADGRQRRSVGTYAFLKPIADLADRTLQDKGVMHQAGSASARHRTEGQVTCSWCEASYEKRPAAPNCDHCGGVLPLPAGFDPGPGPPDAPRELPKGFRYRIYVKNNSGGIIGLIALAVALPLFLLCVTIPVALLLFLFGVIATHSNFLTAYRRCLALQRGVPVLGKIETVHRIGKPQDDRPMYRVYYRFDANGEPLRGMKYTFDTAIEDHFVGEPVWVVYIPQQTACHELWPPLA